MNYLTINKEMFPYENPKYADIDMRITNQHLVIFMTPEVPQTIIEKVEKAKLINIRDLAEAKVLDAHPEYLELTSFGTRKKGYYRLLNEQIRKTFYWAVNKQPASLTIFTNKIDGLSRKEDEPTDPNSVFGKIQLCMQLGIKIQLVIPDTGYSCIVEPVCNKKKMILFSKVFICEKYMAQIQNWEMRDDNDPTVKEIIAAMHENTNMDRLDFARQVWQKCERLQDYRQSVQDEIWKSINYALAPYRDEWKCQNIYTLETRMSFAVNAYTENILLKYAEDFKIPAANALTLDDLRNPQVYDEMIRIIANYGPAFGVSVKVSESVPDTMTYLPHHWIRDDKNTITESIMLKRAYQAQQAFKKAPLSDLLQAYIQIDWYMNQPKPEEFYVEGYDKCECGRPFRQIVTHYYNKSRHALYDMDKFVRYDYQYNDFGETVYPVTVCPHCNKIHSAEGYELLDPVSYEFLAYKLDKDEE